MFEMKPIARHMLLACGGLASALMLAGPVAAQQTQPPKQEQKLERVTITGSNIRRTDTETVAPVEIITREEIEKSGRTTVAEVLKSIPANTGGIFNETANSFAPGSTTVSLRGLGQAATLVLINGRRMASYGFAQNIQDSFVDLSSIPTSAVERIEILKDGASAIYGSDAIAGVVNVILRKDFRGIEVGAGMSFFESGKKEYRANMVAGFGDLGADKYNVFAVVDYMKRDGFKMSDTEFGQDRDYRDQQGGRNFQSLTAGGTWRGTGANSNFFRAYAECPNPVNFTQAAALGLLTPNQAAAAPGTGFNQAGNTWCARDFANSFSLIPTQERIGLISRATVDFTSTMQGYAELGFSRNETKFVFQEPFFAGTTRVYRPAGSTQLAQSPFNAIFAAGSAGNPFGFNATYNGVLNDLGTRDTKATSDAFRLLGGLKYRIADWDLDSALGYSYSQVDQESRVLLTSPTIAALGIPSTIQPPTPVSTNAIYNANRPSLNSQSLRDGLMANNPRSAKSELQFIDTKASTELGNLPGGAIGVAVGVEYRNETIKGLPSTLSSTGEVLGQGSTSVDGSRHSIATYVELSLPLTRTIEAQLALRNDNYSDFGNALTPKVGLKFRPSSEFLMRANWGRGFKAPSLAEISPSSAFFFTSVSDPAQGGALVQIGGSINANPNLQPEKSRSTTVGMVFEPTANFSASVDWFNIVRSNQVTFEDFQAIANNPSDPRAFRDPVTGFLLSIAGQYTNLGQVETKGIDIDARWRLPTSLGAFSTRVSATYLDSYKIDGEQMAGSNLAWGYSNTASLPRWKAAISADWEKGAMLGTVRLNYIHSYDRTYGQIVAPSYFVPGTGNTLPQNGTLDRVSPSYTTIDLFGRYAVTPKLSVSAGVINLFDKLPPWDPSFSTTYFYDRTQSYDPRGRYYNLGVRYKF